jgi:hypothetical protein
VDQYEKVDLKATVTPDKISWNYGVGDTISIEVSNNSYHVKYDKDKCKVYVDYKEQQGDSLYYKTIENIQFFLKRDMKALKHEEIEPNEVNITSMQAYVDSQGVAFDTHPKTPDQTSNPDFFVKIVFDHTKKEGFMNSYVKSRRDVHEFDSTCWLEKDNNYSVLKSIEFSYHYTGPSSQIAQSGSSAPPQKHLQGGAGSMNFGGPSNNGGLILNKVTKVPQVLPTPASSMPMGSNGNGPTAAGGAGATDAGKAPPVAGGAAAGGPPDPGNAAPDAGGAVAPDAAADVPPDTGKAAAADVADQGSVPPSAQAKMTSSFPTAASFGLAPQFEDDVAMSKKKRRTLKIFDDIL